MRKGSLRIFGFQGVPQELIVKLLEANRDRFEYHFAEVIIHSGSLNVPMKAYVANREQYHAEPFLEILRNNRRGSTHALGIVDLDLFVPELNFIFGSAQYSGNAIVALPRLRQTFYGLPSDDDVFFKRTVKEIFHELGHVLGLGHCNNKCVMRFSNSLRDTDIKPETYCPNCLQRL